MSGKSRRRATTSRRRVAMATGALLAGAAIPIAAAGTAWADETQTAGQLEREGLSPSEAKAVVAAEDDGTPVQVSYDGKMIVDANQGGASGDATAASGTKDVAIAIGGGSDRHEHG